MYIRLNGSCTIENMKIKNKYIKVGWTCNFFIARYLIASAIKITLNVVLAIILRSHHHQVEWKECKTKSMQVEIHDREWIIIVKTCFKKQYW